MSNRLKLTDIIGDEPDERFCSIVFFPLRLFAILMNTGFILTGVPYSKDDRAALWLANSIFGEKAIARGDEKLRKWEEETTIAFRAQIKAIQRGER